MLAFRVQLNGETPITGGALDLGVLTATISAVGQLGPHTPRRRSDESIDIDLRLGGLTSRGSGVQDEHLVWLEAHELKPGDRITVEIVETETPDAVQSGSAAKERADVMPLMSNVDMASLCQEGAPNPLPSPDEMSNPLPDGERDGAFGCHPRWMCDG